VVGVVAVMGKYLISPHFIPLYVGFLVF
jgi:hypothetical protein